MTTKESNHKSFIFSEKSSNLPPRSIKGKKALDVPNKYVKQKIMPESSVESGTGSISPICDEKKTTIRKLMVDLSPFTKKL